MTVAGTAGGAIGGTVGEWGGGFLGGALGGLFGPEAVIPGALIGRRLAGWPRLSRVGREPYEPCERGG